MSLSQFLLAIWARKWIVLATLAVSVGTTLAITLWLPKIYSATAEVLVDSRMVDPVSGNVTNSAVLSTYMTTQVEIIRSERVARLVAGTLKLDENTNAVRQWREDTEGRGDFKAWLAGRIQKRLEVKPSKESNVIDITFSGVDPVFTAVVANAFANAYIATLLELKVEPARQNSEFFDARIKAARADLDRAQTRLSSYQRTNNIVAIDERLDVENNRLNELSSQLVAVQAVVAESRSREGAVGRRNSDTLQEVLQSPIVQSLKVEIARTESKLQEITARLGIAHPQYQSTQAELTSLKSKLESETSKVTGGIATSGSVNLQREAQIRASLESQRAKVLKIKEQRDQVGLLQKEVEAAQRQYELVATRFSQTSMESQTRQTNVALLSAATEPGTPSSPRMVLNLVMSIVGGLLLGTAFAYVLESMRPRIRSVGDFAELLQVPVLIVMPSAKRERKALNR